MFTFNSQHGILYPGNRPILNNHPVLEQRWFSSLSMFRKISTFLVLWVFPSPHGVAQGLLGYVGSSAAALRESRRAWWTLPVPGKPTLGTPG